MTCTEDQVRRLIRRRRFSFLYFWKFIKINNLETSWASRNIERGVAEQYAAMGPEAQEYYNNITPAIYRGHYAFYIGAKAALTLEELEAYTFRITEEEIVFDF